jgi:archaellum component FlaC
MSIIIPSSPEDRKRIQACMSEISNSLTRMDAERDFIKEAIIALAEDVDVDKKTLRKMATIYHKQNLSEVTGEMEDLQALYEAVMG